jgi:hypothetical protein
MRGLASGLGAEHLAAPVFVPKAASETTSPPIRPPTEWTNAPAFAPAVASENTHAHAHTPALGHGHAHGHATNSLGFDEGISYDQQPMEGMYVGNAAPRRAVSSTTFACN